MRLSFQAESQAGRGSAPFGSDPICKQGVSGSNPLTSTNCFNYLNSLAASAKFEIEPWHCFTLVVGPTPAVAAGFRTGSLVTRLRQELLELRSLFRR